ncbi:hypothetical protein VTO42DRAFT_6621 [Malbranchea cinnamomea]
MASQRSDKLLWLALGITLFFAARGIAAELQRVRTLTEIRKVEKEEDILGEATEDALKLDTLQKLSETPSYELRAAALKIVAERSTKGSTRDLLLEDLSSPSQAVRMKALNALHFLLSNRTLNRSAMSARLRDVATFTALVNCLCNFLKEHTEEKGTTLSPVLPRTRPLGESKALATLNLILPENLPAALEAGVVSRWLAKYPFPCAVHDESRRRDVFMLMKTWCQDDPLMCSIINTIGSQPEGLKQLRRYGLMGSRLEEMHGDGFGVPGSLTVEDIDDDGFDFDDGDSDVWMANAEDTAGAPVTSTRRQNEASAEEQALRRRRREAMVLSEGGRPLGQEDIIHPIHDDDGEENLEGDANSATPELGETAPDENQSENSSSQSRWSLFSWPLGT